METDKINPSMEKDIMPLESNNGKKRQIIRGIPKSGRVWKEEFGPNKRYYLFIVYIRNLIFI